LAGDRRAAADDSKLLQGVAGLARASSNFSISFLLTLIALPQATTSSAATACLNGEHKACGGGPGIVAIAKPDPALLALRSWRRGRSPFPKARARLRLQAFGPAGSRHLLYAIRPATAARGRRSLDRGRASSIHQPARISGSDHGQPARASLRSFWRRLSKQLIKGDGFESRQSWPAVGLLSAHAASNKSLKAGPSGQAAVAKSKHHGRSKRQLHRPPVARIGRCPSAGLAVCTTPPLAGDGGMQETLGAGNGLIRATRGFGAGWALLNPAVMF